MQTELDRIMKLPAVAAALAEAEGETLAERRALIASLADLNRRETAALREGDGADEAMTAEADRLAAELQDVNRRRDALRVGLNARRTKWDTARRSLIEAIQAGADPRLQPFACWAARCANRANLFAANGFLVAPDGLDDRTKATARRVRVLADTAIERAREMQGEALSHDTVTAELDAMAAGLVEACAAVGVRVPGDYARAGGAW